MATHCQRAVQSGSGERQNIGTVNSLEGEKKGGGGGQLQTKFDFRGRWSATPKNRERSKKTQGRTAMINGDSSLAVGSYPERGSAPHKLLILFMQYRGFIYSFSLSESQLFLY